MQDQQQGGCFQQGGRFGGRGRGRGNYYQQQYYNNNQQQYPPQNPNDSYANYPSEISYMGSSNSLPPPPQSGYQSNNYYHQQPQFPRGGSRW